MPPMPEGVERGHPQGHVPLRGTPAKPQGEAAGPAARQRRDPERGAQGAGDARGEVRRRRPTSGASPATRSSTATAHACERWNLLHPARSRACRTSPQCLGRGAGRDRGGLRLREGAARRDRRWVPRPLRRARHRRLRPQREPRGAARFFEVDARFIVARRARRRSRAEGKIEAKAGGEGDRGAGDRRREGQPGDWHRVVEEKAASTLTELYASRAGREHRAAATWCGCW